jgi:hypothetical protein
LILAAATAVMLGGAWVAVPALTGLGILVPPVVTPPDPVPVPAGLTVATGCDGWLSAGAEISWSPSEGATAYRIFRSESGGGWTAIDTVAAPELAAPGAGDPGLVPDASGRALRYRDGDLGVSLTYGYRIQALDGIRVSARSTAVYADTPLLCLA